MSLPMRITFEGKDYTYSVLTKNINKDTLEIKIGLENNELTIIRTRNNEWNCPELTENNKHDLLKAIGKNIALRYRL